MLAEQPTRLHLPNPSLTSPLLHTAMLSQLLRYDFLRPAPHPASHHPQVPFLLKLTLREYQHIGLDWLVTIYKKRLNGILADEVRVWGHTV